ncbi:MAG: hypothetical protein ABIX01_08470 [Chitinophagaceae bacterium]
MRSNVCTLFEGHYHYGVAALTNSLYQYGFRGAVYAGYRGELPEWAASATINPGIDWAGCRTLSVVDGLEIHFIPVVTDYHLTNYKPDFMLRLWEGPGMDADGLAYFDPDIVVKCKWDFFERWMSYGVALVHEIVSNDMPPTHPIRMEWHEVIEKTGMQKNRDIMSYINGGFCGVSRKYIEFLEVWSNVIKTAIRHYGQDPAVFASYDRTSTFWNVDQDAFNIAAMCCVSPISEMGSEGMDFINAGWTMSHATGSPKPWKKNFLKLVLSGKPPTLAEKGFWLHAATPITAFSQSYIRYKSICIAIASFGGRFYRRY